MEIELPDGTVLEAPDDADIKKVVQGYRQSQTTARMAAKDPAEYDVNSNQYKARYGAQDSMQVKTPDMDPGQQQAMLDMGLSPSQFAQRFGKQKEAPTVDPNQKAALGSGMLRGWKGLTNLVLPDSLTPEWASDKNIQEMDQRDEELPMAGKLAGNLAATAPLSGALGAAQRGATALSTASKAPALLTRALGSGATRAALEGGTQGAIYADPEHQGEGALVGAALGTGLHGLGKVGGRVLRGAVEKSESAKALEQLAAQHGDEIFLPLAQAASDDGLISPLAKGFYKDALPIVPTVKGQLEKQSTKAADKLREISVKEALPSGSPLPPNSGSKVGAAVKTLEKEFDDAYDQTVKSYSFNVPKDLDAKIGAAIKAGTDPKTVVNKTTASKVIAEVKALFAQFSDGKPHIDGQNLLNVKRMISKLIGEAENHEKGAFRSADKMIDDLIETEMKQGGKAQNLADLKRYKDLTPAYRAFSPLATVAEGAADKEGRFLFRSLAKEAEHSPEQRLIGQIGADTVDKPATGSSLVGKILGGAATGGAGIGAFMAPAATAAVVGGGRLLGSKGVQKALMGDTKLQKMLVELLRKYPNAARRMGSLGRQASVQSAVGE
jgi:hypothetical protein